MVPFYAFPAEVRRLLYTTNAIEALNSKLRRAVRARGHFPTDEAALKLLFLVLNRSEKEWTIPAGVVHGQSTVRHPLRRALHTSHGLNRINRPTHTHEISDTAAAPDGTLQVTCPELPQVDARDATLAGALARAEDAIDAIWAGEFHKPEGAA